MRTFLRDHAGDAIINDKHANWLVIGFFLIIIAIVFQQIATSMTVQGIASGSPYDNAAAYPRAVAIIIGILLLIQAALGRLNRTVKTVNVTPLETLIKPALLLGIFAVYLALLGWLGYHLTTSLMIMAIMMLCGVRSVTTLIASSVGISLLFAFLFEYFLKIVLPGGIFSLNIPW